MKIKSIFNRILFKCWRKNWRVIQTMLCRFWLYYRRLEKEKFKWPYNLQETINISFNELEWLLNGHELRLEKRKFKEIKERVFY